MDFRCFLYFLIVLAELLCFIYPYPAFSLNRDYWILDENGKIDDIKQLDEWNDISELYYCHLCIDHFHKSYLNLPAYDERHDKFYEYPIKCLCPLPNIDKSLLYLVPQAFLGAVCTAWSKPKILCQQPTNYTGYLDPDFRIFNPFLEEQLIHFQSHKDCDCFWPELNKNAAKLSDLAYLLFEDFGILQKILQTSPMNL